MWPLLITFDRESGVFMLDATKLITATYTEGLRQEADIE